MGVHLFWKCLGSSTVHSVALWESDYYRLYIFAASCRILLFPVGSYLLPLCSVALFANKAGIINTWQVSNALSSYALILLS